MGKKIDRFVITSLLAIFLFFYFNAAFENRIIAILLACLCCILTGKAYRQLKSLVLRTSWHQKGVLRRKAGSVLMHLACMKKNEALAHVDTLLKDCYQNTAFIELVQLHPSLQLSSNQVFELWRSHRDLQELVICTTGICTSETRILANSLKQPRIAVLDASSLSHLVSEHPQGFYPAAEEKTKYRLHLKRFAYLLFNRRNAPRCILFSFSMLVMYVFSGAQWYLMFSLLLLFIALASLRHPAKPAKLF